jgi:hypothetical protein
MVGQVSSLLFGTRARRAPYSSFTRLSFVLCAAFSALVGNLGAVTTPWGPDESTVIYKTVYYKTRTVDVPVLDPETSEPTGETTEVPETATTSSIGTKADWVITSDEYVLSSWTPDRDTVDLYAPMTQTRTRHLVVHWLERLSGITEDEPRAPQTTFDGSTNETTGTLDRMTSSDPQIWYYPWSPDESTIRIGTPFTQRGVAYHKEVWLSGNKIVLEPGWDQERSMVGTKPIQWNNNGTATISYGPWVPSDPALWVEADHFTNVTQNFTQSRTSNQPVVDSADSNNTSSVPTALTPNTDSKTGTKPLVWDGLWVAVANSEFGVPGEWTPSDPALWDPALHFKTETVNFSRVTVYYTKEAHSNDATITRNVASATANSTETPSKTGTMDPPVASSVTIAAAVASVEINGTVSITATSIGAAVTGTAIVQSFTKLGVPEVTTAAESAAAGNLSFSFSAAWVGTYTFTPKYTETPAGVEPTVWQSGTPTTVTVTSTLGQGSSPQYSIGGSAYTGVNGKEKSLGPVITYRTNRAGNIDYRYGSIYFGGAVQGAVGHAFYNDGSATLYRVRDGVTLQLGSTMSFGDIVTGYNVFSHAEATLTHDYPYDENGNGDQFKVGDEYYVRWFIRGTNQGDSWRITRQENNVTVDGQISQVASVTTGGNTLGAVTFTPSVHTYNGEAQTVTVTSVPSAVGFTQVSGESAGESSATLAGPYALSGYAQDNDWNQTPQEVTWTIKKRDQPAPTITAQPSNGPWGSNFTASATGLTDGGQLTWSVDGLVWTNFSGGEVSYSPLSVGTGTLTFQFSQSGDANNNESPTSSSNTVNILKKNQITPITYSGPLTVNVNGTIAGAIGGGDGDGAYAWKISGTNFTAGGSVSETASTAGSATLTAHRKGNGDYNQSNDATFTIAVNADVTFTFSGNGDVVYDALPHQVTAAPDLAGASAFLTWVPANSAQTNVGLTNYTVTAGTPYAGDATTFLNITPKALAINAGNQSRKYGEANPTPSWTGEGYAGSESSSVVAGVAAFDFGGAGPTSSPGPYAITYASGLSSSNYSISAGTAGTLTIGKATAPVTITNLSHGYNGGTKQATVTTDPAGLTTVVTYNGSATLPSARGDYTVLAVINDTNYEGEGTATLSIVQGTASISLSGLGPHTYAPSTPRVVTATTNPSVSYSISYGGSPSAPTNAGSYNVVGTITDSNYTGSTSGTLVINQATPVITWNDPATIYTSTALSSTQLNATANVAGTFTYSNQVGTYLAAGAAVPLSVTFVPTDTSNYSSANKTVYVEVIDRIPPVITWPSPAAISYPTPLSGTQLNATATVSGVPVPGTFLYTPPSGTILDAGTKTLSVVFTPTNQAVYATIGASTTINVLAVPLTITGGAASRVYGAVNPTVAAFTSSGLVNGDLVTSVTNTVGATATTGVGTHAVIVPSSAVFAPVTSLANYTITYLPGTLTITPALLAITASDASRLYGNTNPSFSYTVTGLLNGETSSVLSGGPNYATLDTVASPVGSYQITPSRGTLAASNYDLVNSTYVPGTLTVSRRPLTITAGNLSRIYGDANPVPLGNDFTVSTTAPSNLVNGDTISSVAHTVNATVTSNVGTGYSITPSAASFSAGNASNYDITYADGDLAITVRPLTVDGLPATKEYGAADPVFTYTTRAGASQGLVNGDTLTGAAGRVAGESVVGSPYATTKGTLANPNYNVIYNPGALTITPAVLTITATNKSRVYGDGEPAYTYTSSGFKFSDTNAVIGGSPSFTTDADVYSDAGGVYHIFIEKNTLTAANYTFLMQDGLLTITKWMQALNAQSFSRQYNTPNPSQFPYYTAFFRNEDGPSSFSGEPEITTTATISSDAGSYPITIAVGTLTSTNYHISFSNPGILTIVKIDQAPPSLQANPVTIAYLGGDITLTATSAEGAGDHVYTIVSGPGTFGGSNTATLTPTGSPAVSSLALSTTGAGLITVRVHRVGDQNHYPSNAATLVIPVSQCIPTITWANPSAITYPTPLGPTQLNAVASAPGFAPLPGSYDYSPDAGIVLSGGSQTLSVTFNPTNSTDFAQATANATILVNRATTEISIAPVAAEVYLMQTQLITPTVLRTGAFAASLGAPASVTYSILSATGSAAGSVSPATGASTVFTMTAGGYRDTVSVTANFPGDINHLPSAVTVPAVMTIPLPAMLQVSTNAYTFPNGAAIFPQNASASAPFSPTYDILLTNIGERVLTISGVSVTHTTPPEISFSAAVPTLSAMTPVLLAPGASTTMTVTFSPTVNAGLRNATITIQSDSAGGLVSIVVQGVAKRPQLVPSWQ